ncbi:hypothetical protein BT092_08510 [Corynebacterium diphtheriae]|nr:hypothetical protein BT092_08510 [Corynebacterium diphtheriae]
MKVKEEPDHAKLSFSCTWHSYAQFTHLRKVRMNKFSRTARSVTFAAIVGLSLGVSAPGAFVVAQEGRAADVATGAGNIDFQKTGSITLHKLIGGETETRATGLEMHGVPGNPVGDNRVSFSVQKVKADLTTNKGFEEAKALTPETAAKQLEGEAQSQPVTSGVAKFNGLPIGVYLVKETVLDAGDGEKTLIPGKDFLVYIPTTAPDGNKWIYDVHAYPKNSENQVTKEVSDAEKNSGENITYTITGQAPVITGEQKATSYFFTDELDQQLVEFANNVSVSIGDMKLEPQDYKVDSQKDQPGTGIHKGKQVEKLTVTLQSTGLAKFTKETSGKPVVLKFDAKIKPIEGDDNEINNEATVTFDNPNTGSKVDLKTKGVKTIEGKLKIVKKDSDNNEPLKGAKFALYKCQGQESIEELQATTKIRVNNEDSWTTDDKGEVTINSLHVTDFADNKPSDVYKYCLVETEAPAGYKKLVKPVPVDFKRSDLGAKGETTALTQVAEIQNIRKETPELPLTGGAGVGILAAIGAAIIGAGAWFARRNSAEA